MTKPRAGKRYAQVVKAPGYKQRKPRRVRAYASKRHAWTQPVAVRDTRCARRCRCASWRSYGEVRVVEPRKRRHVERTYVGEPRQYRVRPLNRRGGLTSRTHRLYIR